MALQVGTNSYVDLDEANEYFKAKLFADEWNNANDDTKEKALIEACRRIERLTFKGTKRDLNQTLSFPRVILNVIQTDVPDAVKAAQCEEALALLKFGNSARTKAREQGVKVVRFGNVSEDYAPTKKLLSSEALELLKPYLAGAVNIR